MLVEIAVAAGPPAYRPFQQVIVGIAMDTHVLPGCQIPVFGRMEKDFSPTKCVRGFATRHSQELRGVFPGELPDLLFWQMRLRRQKRTFWNAVDPVPVSGGGDVDMAVFSGFAISG